MTALSSEIRVNTSTTSSVTVDKCGAYPSVLCDSAMKNSDTTDLHLCFTVLRVCSKTLSPLILTAAQ